MNVQNRFKMSFFEFSEKINELSKIALKKAEEQSEIIDEITEYNCT